MGRNGSFEKKVVAVTPRRSPALCDYINRKNLVKGFYLLQVYSYSYL